DADPAVRAAASAELAVDPSPRATELLLWQLYSDPMPEVRLAAVRAIELRGDPGLGPHLQRAASLDGSPEVRAAAAAAYERLWPLAKSPRRAGLLSILCPGCGHFYLRQTGTGFAYLGTSVALIGGAVWLLSNNDEPSDALDPAGVDRDPEDPLVLPLGA